MNYNPVVIDIESSSLLSKMIDYSSIPYKLNSGAKLHVVSIRNVLSNKVVRLVKEEITKERLKKELNEATHLIAHNGIKFDFITLYLFGVLDYKIGYLFEPDLLFDREIVFVDTLVLSRLSFPDRYKGHSLESWGEKLGNAKTDYRQACIDAGIIDKNSLPGTEFLEYNDIMAEYCDQDTNVNRDVFLALIEELKGHSWQQSIKLENKIADGAIRRETFGFSFDKPLALKLLEDLANKMEDLRLKVDPILPPKPMTKTEIKDFTPPKNQFKKDGEPSANLLKFVERVQGVLEEIEETYYLLWQGKEFTLPYYEPLKTHVPASIDNLDHVKMHLISLGWIPSEWRERDLTKDSKKQNLSYEKRIAAMERWVKETFEGKYTKQRLEIIKENYNVSTEEDILEFFTEKLKDDKPVRIPTSPTVRVGVEKELCPSLVSLGEKVAFASDFALYLTYKHRKASIAGGDIEDMDFDEETPNTGYLSLYREQDGRIPTPAIEIGSSTCRYRHIGVANIPRASSIYGKEMRSLFGSGKDGFEFGYDFASLEARIMGHYIMKYDGEELSKTLLAEKPKDLHTLTGLKMGIPRSDAKSVNYACLPMHTEILTKKGWKYFDEVNEGDVIVTMNVERNILEDDVILKKHFFKDKEVFGLCSTDYSLEATADHRWIGYRDNKLSWFTTENLRDEDELITTAPYLGGISIISPDKARKMVDIICNSDKDYSDWVLTLTPYALQAFLESFCKSNLKIITIKKSKKNIFNTIITALQLLGQGSVSWYEMKDSYVINVGLNNKLKSSNITKHCLGIQDTFCLTTNNSTFVIRQNNIITVTGNCMYGAQPAKLAKMLRVSVNRGKEIFNDYWDSVKPLKNLKEKVEAYWESTGKKYIIGIDGRKIFIRSKHSILNALFQSAGVIVAKYVNMFSMEILENKGYNIDVFKAVPDIIEMIAYHDECQLFVTPKIVKFKTFNSEEEAKEFSKNWKGSQLGAVSKAKKYYVTLPNDISEAILEAIDKTEKLLKLNVPIGIEYTVGRNWYECH